MYFGWYYARQSTICFIDLTLINYIFHNPSKLGSLFDFHYLCGGRDDM